MASYAGVRPLYENNAGSNSTVTRDYQFELDVGKSGEAPPILSIFGGKITTYRKLAEHALEKLPNAPGGSWTADAPLPGGDIDPSQFDAFVAPAAPSCTCTSLQKSKSRSAIGSNANAFQPS